MFKLSSSRLKKILLSILILLLFISSLSYFLFFKVERYSSRLLLASEINLKSPALSYPNIYSGPLYAVSEKLGEANHLDKLMENMDRNGVNFMIGYFGIEVDMPFSSLWAKKDAGVLVSALSKYPGRILPFFSTGLGGKEEGDSMGDELVNMYGKVVETANKAGGDGFVRGLGEVEIQAWDRRHDDAGVLKLFDFADKNKLPVMFHPGVGQTEALSNIFVKYPNTKFIIHMFRNDFVRERSNIISLMSLYPNVYFTVDADHLLFDNSTRIGLLYKYEKISVGEAVENFIHDYDRMEVDLLKKAAFDYKPLVDAHPGRVMWGTEMHNEYNFDSQVYDRTIKFMRAFITQLKTADQEKFAYKNALEIFGPGIVLEKK